ncbi:MAG: hypothetical protein OEN20_12405 [Gammaproteobacteria bacterium]|nr:hypothetical protein [Gammaproteobacteria bacterium]
MQRRSSIPLLIGALAICLAQSAVAEDTSQPFTDHDLARLLDNHTRGVIYLWSPHMSYSVRGAAEAQRVVDGLGLVSVLLLDPHAEPALVASVRRSHRLPDSATRRMRASALWDIGATQHYPTVVVFASGRLDAQMLPGYTPPGDLRAYIRQRLQDF